MSRLFFIICTVVFSSCFLFKDFREKTFSYEQNGQSYVIPLMVPTGYTSVKQVDTAGINMQVFHYPGSAFFYTAFVADTATEIFPFNKKIHQPLLHKNGGLIFKGQEENGLFFREIRQGNLRFGYRNVSAANEWYFDEATNRASLSWKK